jgi:raffinose/stachyose/melibiose transport system permease protein
LLAVVLLALHQPGSTVTGLSIPTDPSLAAFKTVWNEGQMASALLSSFIVASVVVVGTLVVSIAAGYAFGTMAFRGRTVLFYVLLLTMIVPYESTILPLYYELRSLNLLDTYWALILPQIATYFAFGTFWMTTFFRSTPRPLLDSAKVDGATSFRTLWSILLPLARPPILALAVILFMIAWNEFLLALVMIQNESLRTAPVALAFFSGSQRTNDFTLIAAAALVVALPVVVVYAILQRRMAQGFLSGAIKE